MSDLISRQAAIDLLKAYTEKNNLGHTPLQIVEHLPSAERNTICGYDMDNIILFAMMCRKVGITNDNLRDFAIGCGDAYARIHKALYDEVSESIMRTFAHCTADMGGEQNDMR